MKIIILKYTNLTTKIMNVYFYNILFISMILFIRHIYSMYLFTVRNILLNLFGLLVGRGFCMNKEYKKKNQNL